MFLFFTLGPLKKEPRRRAAWEDRRVSEDLACWHQVLKEGHIGRD